MQKGSIKQLILNKLGSLIKRLKINKQIVIENPYSTYNVENTTSSGNSVLHNEIFILHQIKIKELITEREMKKNIRISKLISKKKELFLQTMKELRNQNVSLYIFT